jgi:hypothetical protein
LKVKCISLTKLVKNGTYDSLRVGHEYVVLAIEIYDHSRSTFSQSIGDFVLYRIRGNDGFISPFPAKLFEITKASLGTNWVSFRESDDSYSLLPEKWARKSFWDDYYNDDDYAHRDFKIEEELMLDEN